MKMKVNDGCGVVWAPYLELILIKYINKNLYKRVRKSLKVDEEQKNATKFKLTNRAGGKILEALCRLVKIGLKT